MLQIKSLYPMSNFTRVTHEFLDDKIIVKVKSFVTEFENEVKYSDIKHIQLVRTADLRWLSLGLFIMTIPGFMSWIFSLLQWNILDNLPLPIIGKLVIAAGIVLCIPAFHKNEVFFFMDQARNNVISIKIDSKNKLGIHQAVELVRQKATITSETNPETPFPDSPLFEYDHYDFSDLLNKTVTMFYENNFIFKDTSLAEDVVTKVNYDELSGKVIRVKSTNNRWSSMALYLVFIFASLFWAVEYLFPQIWQTLSLGLFIKIALGSAGFLFLLSFFKREVFLFYNTSEKIVYWTQPNRKNSKRLENIIEHVKSKAKNA